MTLEDIRNGRGLYLVGMGLMNLSKVSTPRII